MTEAIGRLDDIAPNYDAVVFDQWGVLHDGSTPYRGTVSTLVRLKEAGHRLAVLSNSGKRAEPNAELIAGLGFPAGLFETVMTSGEALWRDISAGRIACRSFFPVERAAGDALIWAESLEIALVCKLCEADAVLLMGLPDGDAPADWTAVLEEAYRRGLPLYCSNPDRASPRPGGLVHSPGALAFAYLEMGGEVSFYGKPHRPVFDALQDALGAARLLMVGDSLEHDVAGAAEAGWDSLLIQGGLYAEEFSRGDADGVLERLVVDSGGAMPTYRLDSLQ